MPTFPWNPISKEAMPLDQQFELAGGSVIGREHLEKKMNNQDGYAFVNERRFAIGVITDGCTSEAHSEVGAQFGAPLAASAVARHVRKILDRNPYATVFDQSWFWERIRQDVLAMLRTTALSMGENFAQVVFDYFLFTVVGFIVTPIQSVFFTIGDGVIYVNGEEIPVGPFPENKPPYLAYGLLDPGQMTLDPKVLTFTLQRVIPTADLRTFLIGADGVNHFIAAAERNVPGREEKVGTIDQFWTNDLFFRNPVAVTLRLSVVNRDTRTIDWSAQRVIPHAGLLPDDTTLIVGRRRK